MTPLRIVKSITVTPAMLLGTDVPEADHPAYNPATTYGLGDRVIMLSTHKVYESMDVANVGHQPDVSPTWWGEVSPTNRWKAFDLSSTTRTQIGASAYYVIKPGKAINAVALIGISGLQSVRVRLTDPDYGQVYDRTVNLGSLPTSPSWWAWLFDRTGESVQLILRDLPTYPSATLRVDMTSTGTGYVGVLAMGALRTVGMGILSGVRLGIQDYSRKEKNDWGDVVLVQRAFAARASFPLLVANGELDATYDLLAELRATPAIFIGSERLRSLTVFGYYTDFDLGLEYADSTELTLNVEGLSQS